MGLQRQEQAQEDRVKMRLARRMAQGGGTFGGHPAQGGPGQPQSAWADRNGNPIPAPAHPGAPMLRGGILRSGPDAKANQEGTTVKPVHGGIVRGGDNSLARVLGGLNNPNADLVAGGTPEQRQQARRGQLETLHPDARGAPVAAAYAANSNYTDPGQDSQQRYAAGKALLAKKLAGGGDQFQGGTSQQRRKIRDFERFTQFIQAAGGK